MRKVMVFGVFDGIHEGHRSLFRQARKFGDYVIAVVAQDHIVEHLKGHLPLRNLTERFEHLKREDGVDEVVIGDSEIGTWEVAKRYRPEVIALGYDQKTLKENLEAHQEKFDWKPEIKIMQAYEPDTHYSSVLGKQ